MVDDGHPCGKGKELNRAAVGPGCLAGPEVATPVLHLEKEGSGLRVGIGKENRFRGVEEELFRFIIY